jgi:hypothetical protein
MGRLYDRIAAALLWAAAFSLAAGVFLSTTLLFQWLPPTRPVAVGAVPIERYSKLQDYVAALIIFLAVPPLTVWFQRIGGRILARERRRFRPSRHMTVAVLFTVPLLLCPAFYVTTGKVGWILLLPLALSFGSVRVLYVYETRRWLRALVRRDLDPYHALIFCEGLAWIIYRYIATGWRIAHYPTLFLETVFVGFFLFLVFAVAVYASRLAELSFGVPGEQVYRRIATGALPLVVLPVIPILFVPTTYRAIVMIVALLVVAVSILLVKTPIGPERARGLAGYVILPALIYCLSYASTAQLLQWIDLFHRGESIGPASDYLRGKAPYSGVFALHGMLEDGLLDAWLMELFGRSLDVAIARTVVLGAFLPVALWYLGLAVFRSIPLALLVVAMGSWTTTENNRTFFQVAAVALFWIALDRGSRAAAGAAGALAAVALFFSYEIGLYTIAGMVISAVLLRITGAPRSMRTLAVTAFGFVLGAAPFVIYLLSRGAFDDFVVTSFVTIPRIIDAVWSLPFPDVVTSFRKNLGLHALAAFVLSEKFHLILSPLTIAIAAAYLTQRAVRRRIDRFDSALLVLTVFAAIAQRTAFGRVSFNHQYFAAFLIGPILTMLVILLARRLAELWTRRDEAMRAFIVTLVAALIPLVAVLFWIPDLVNVRIEDLVRYQGRILRVIHDRRADEVRWRITTVSEEITALTKWNDPVFDFSNQPAFYFFADRPNPTRFYQVPIASPRAFQEEIIAALERARPRVVIRTSPENFDEFDGIPNTMRAQAVAAYLDDCYRFYVSRRGVELWVRDQAARPASIASYLARIRLPARSELTYARRMRMVFPAVGSTPGANNSYWVSDLTLHNPFREPITVSLRYQSPEARLDRRLTLAPRQTMRWPDVVRTYFGSSGRGALWLEAREGRTPVAIVQTSDIAHGGRASIELPLTIRDAATAETDVAELAIVGIPAARAPGRRINIGVVNLGIVPGGFRLSARSRTGATIGKPVETGMPEDETWLINDVENVLGISIDETTTLRITALASTGVAFATVVEANGDTEYIPAVPTQQQ